MPYFEKKIEKVYYKIGELAEIINCSTSKIRFWIGYFDWLDPKFNRHGHRQFTRTEAKELVNIDYLVKNGMTLEGINQANEGGYIDELIAFFMDHNFNYGVKQAEKL